MSEEQTENHPTPEQRLGGITNHSMSNNQNNATLKASIAELVGPLLKCLKLAEEKFSEKLEMKEIIKKIRDEVVKTTVTLNKIKNWDMEQIGYFGKIERQIGPWIDCNDTMTEMNENTITNELLDIFKKLSHKPGENTTDLPHNGGKPDVPESSNTNYQENTLPMDLKDPMALDVLSGLCLYSLGIFPESEELKKRFVIYWWTGLGLLPWYNWEKAEQLGHKTFSDLVDKGFLKSVHIREHNQVIDRCTINRTIHKWLLSANEKNDSISYDKGEDFISPFFGDWFNSKVLVNLHDRYLKSEAISSKHHLQVVQLGSWHYTDTKTMSDYHIEVDETDFLKRLGEKVTYLSLRGISGIEEVDESIGKLENLMILDLRACHNLTKLPEKPRSTLQQKFLKKSWFKKLLVLDISECYLLDHMPKWICELYNLEVLKGFVVGSVGNKTQSCRLGDLSKLNKLSKLSIRIANDIFGREVFRGFNTLDSVLVLTITWGVNKYKEIPTYSLPTNLEKLDMRCYPEANASKLQNPEELKNLKRLYIRGGNLTEIPCHGNWQVEILRLRLLERLDCPTDWEELRSSFKNLKYVEYVKKNGSSWSRKDDLRHMQEDGGDEIREASKPDDE